MKFLEVRQILADYKSLIEHIRSTNDNLSDGKLILYATSDYYSSAITTWFHHTYPTIADIVYVSGAVVNSQLITTGKRRRYSLFL